MRKRCSDVDSRTCNPASPTRRDVARLLTFTALFASLSGCATGNLAMASPAAAQSPRRTTWAQANGVTLRYELTGKGPRTLVLLHELGTSLESWDDIAPDLARSNRVLRYDLRGFGLSQRVDGDLTIDDEIEDLRALLAALGIEGSVTLIGGAVGGAISLAFAARYPERVDGVVAISPAAYMAPRVTPSASSGNSAPPATQPGALEEPAYPREIQERNPERYRRFKAISGTSSTGGGPTARAVYAVAFAQIMPKIQCPVLVVANTPWMRSIASFKELASAAPRGETVVVNTAHFATIASPELLLPILHDFLGKLPS